MTCTVIGGGLSGLTAAIELARSGATVRLLEQHHELGGRAMTTAREGFCLNLGPHALYRGGATHRALVDWGILPSGSRPALSADSYMVLGDRKFPLIRDAVGLATNSYFSVLERIEAGRVLLKITGGHAESGVGLTIGEWLDREISSVNVRRFAETLVRVSTYCDDPAQSAEAALRQTHLATEGVLYVDGGWQAIVSNLAAYARSLGVEIETGVRVQGIEGNTILAVPPRAVEKLTGSLLPKQHKIRLAALDLALDSLPEGAAVFGLGLDEPLYFSLHSRWAKLAPEGGALVHVGKYMGTRRSDPAGDREQLERFADVLMPGWRERVHYARFLPDMDVTHSIVPVGGRLDVDVLGMAGVRIAGDWVGHEVMLADAAVASGLRAARQLKPA